MNSYDISGRLETPYISIKRSKCRACWKCISVCPNHVLGRINFIFHRHVVVIEPKGCTGCLACEKVCPHSAIIQFNRHSNKQ